MSAYAIVTGVLHKAAEERTSKAGKKYVSAVLTVKDGVDRQWWRLTAFAAAAQAELARLDAGDVVAVQGSFQAGLYAASDGSQKLSLSLVADHVLALRQPPKKRIPKTSEPAPQDTRTRVRRCRGEWQPGAGPSDAIPFEGES